MKRIAALVFICSLAVVGSGCATSGYFAARLGDAADIFTATLGVGAGVKVRVGPIQPALIYDYDLVGLRGGRFFARPTPDDRRGTTIGVGEELFLPFYARFEIGEINPPLCGVGEYKSRLDKTFFEWSRFPLIVWGYPGRANAQIEVAGGLGLVARVGFNPLELVDFFLGWFSLDICGDDPD